MNAGSTMNRPFGGAGVWMACLIGLLVGSGRAEETILTSGSLGAVEYRALLAQSLTQQVDEMKGESDELRKQLEKKDALLKDTLDLLAQSRTEVETLQKNLAEWEKELAKRDQLLAVFRRGSFEYYEVRPGDTLESIAANPMVYGDAARSVWLRQANSLPEDGKVEAGTVLIIPRFPEGTSYDL